MKIIDPWMIYLASRADALIAFSAILTMLSIAAIFLLWLAKHEGAFAEKEDKYSRLVRLAVAGTVVGLVLAMALPDKETCIEMLIADRITYETVGSGFEKIREVVDYVFEKVGD